MLDDVLANHNAADAGGGRAGEGQVRAVLVLVWIGLAAGMVISWPLWAGAGTRVFPELPVVEFWKPWPSPWDAVLAGAVLLLTGAGVGLRLAGKQGGWGLLAAGVAGFLLMVGQDQVRWQPWVFQYLVMLGLAVLVGSAAGRGVGTGARLGNRVSTEPTAGGGTDRDSALLAGWRIFLIGTYFWSGVHKLGPGFGNLYEAAFLAPLEGLWPAGILQMLRWQGPLIPWIEMAAAVALCFGATRKAGVVLTAGTHAVILLLLGPWGTGSNAVVLPWNAVMIPMVAVVFWKARAVGWRELWQPGFRGAAAGVLALVTVTPVLGWLGKWDRYASFQLYSGTDRRLFLVLDAAAVQALPAEYHAYLRPSPADPAFQELRFVEWSLKELRVPVPAEERLFLALGKRFAGMEAARKGRSFFYVDYGFLLKERGWDTHSAAAMAGMESFPPLRKTPPSF